MDPETIAPGTAVWIRPVAGSAAHPNGRWREAYVVSVQGRHEHDVYVLYDPKDERFIEISQEAIELTRDRIPHTERWDWMRAYVIALDMGSKKLQKEVEGFMRNSKTLGGRAFAGKNIMEITAGQGKTLLHVAVFLGRYKIVQWFLSGIEDDWVNKEDKWGSTALDIACEIRRLDICKLLLEHRADPNLVKRRHYADHNTDDVSKIVMLYGGVGHVFMHGRILPTVASVLTHALCSSAPISKLPTDILRMYVLPMLVSL